MIPAGLILGFAKKLPWGKIILGVIIGASLFGVFLYVKDAEGNREAVKTLKVEKQALKTAIVDIKSHYDEQLEVLTENFEKHKERETRYAESIKKIQSGPDGSCGRNSDAISNAIRLRSGAK